MLAYIAALPAIIFDNPVLGVPLLAVGFIGFCTLLAVVGKTER